MIWDTDWVSLQERLPYVLLSSTCNIPQWMPYFMIRVPAYLQEKFKSRFIRTSLNFKHTPEARMLAESMASRAISLPGYVPASSQKSR